MSYHECPIEPYDWNNGDGNYEEGNCHECEGTGEVIHDDNTEHTCPACGGSGFVECDQPDMGDFL